MCNTYTNGYNDYNVNYRCISGYTFNRSDLFSKKELMLMLLLLYIYIFDNFIYYYTIFYKSNFSS